MGGEHSRPRRPVRRAGGPGRVAGAGDGQENGRKRSGPESGLRAASSATTGVSAGRPAHRRGGRETFAFLRSAGVAGDRRRSSQSVFDAIVGRKRASPGGVSNARYACGGSVVRTTRTPAVMCRSAASGNRHVERLFPMSVRRWRRWTVLLTRDRF